MLESRVILTETGQRRVLVRGASSWHEERARPGAYLCTLTATLTGVMLVSGALVLLQTVTEQAPSNSRNFAVSNKGSDEESSLQLSDARIDTQRFRPASEAAEVNTTASISSQPKAPAAVTAQPKLQSETESAPLPDQTAPDGDNDPVIATRSQQSLHSDEGSSRQLSDARIGAQRFRPASEAAEVNTTASISSQPKAPAAVTAQPKLQSETESAPLQDQTVPDDSEPIVTARSQQMLHSNDRPFSEIPSAQQAAQPVLTREVAETDNTEASSKKAPPLPTRKDNTYARQLADASGDKPTSLSHASSRAQPMALAPRDPATAPRHVSLSAYNGRVFGALARHKPNVGRPGSTKVAFGIGANGQLAFVRVVGSSGDKNLDHLAAAAVRNAAPFPRPPAGPVTYSIRIYFR